MVKNLPLNAGDTNSVLGLEDPLEKEMAPYSSILTWEIPWTEEPGGLQSIGLQRVRQLKQRSKQDIKRSICTTASPPV